MDPVPDICSVACPMPIIKTKNDIVELQSGRVLKMISPGPGSVPDMNASFQDGQGQPGAYKVSLLGNILAKPEWPREILRIIYSLDPCMAYATHWMDVRESHLTRISLERLAQALDMSVDKPLK